MSEIVKTGGIIALLPVLLPFLVLVLIGIGFRALYIRAWFLSCHLWRGKRLVFIYSDSPNWQDYVEREILPRLGNQAIVWNWSERRHWTWSQRALFAHFGGEREYCPLAVVFSSFPKVSCVRFFSAFKQHKHGKSEELQRAEERLYRRVSAAA